MQRHLVSLASVLVAGLLVGACTQAAPAPTAAPAAPKPVAPTAAPAVPTKAPAAPTTAPAAATKAPGAATTAPAAAQPPAAKAPAFPEKGKSISFIVPWAAGAGADASARILAAGLEKELGIPVQVINKEGASSQVGLTELARAKPDGYTIGFPSLPTSLFTYLDASRKAAYGRKELQPVANQVFDPSVVAVATGSPYKTLQEVLDAGKAKPEQVKVGTAGLMSAQHLMGLLLEQQTGAKWAYVHFPAGAAPLNAALLGGHVDVDPDLVGNILPSVKAGNARVLGIADAKESEFLPGVKTLAAQGVKLEFGVSRGVAAPGGTPREVVATLSGAIERVTSATDYKKRITDMGMESRFMGWEPYTAYWDSLEGAMRPLVQLAVPK